MLTALMTAPFTIGLALAVTAGTAVSRRWCAGAVRPAADPPGLRVLSPCWGLGQTCMALPASPWPGPAWTKPESS